MIVKVHLPGRPVRSYVAVDLRLGENVITIREHPTNRAIRILAPTGTVVRCESKR